MEDGTWSLNNVNAAAKMCGEEIGEGGGRRGRTVEGGGRRGEGEGRGEEEER